MASSAWQDGSMDAAHSPRRMELDRFVERIPFNETRGYVRRVLTDDAIFHWRMTGRLRRISDELPGIVSMSRPTENTDRG